MTHFPERLSDIARMVDARLGTLLAPATPFEAQSSGQSGVPARLNAAMRHAVLTGGKRFRPFLLVECAELFAVPPGSSMDAALALECIHCYSLAHDDLPCMDNDKLRRGQPTVWTAYDEWTAVLAGDALQTLAFEILTSPACHADAGVRCALAGALAKASGPAGMVGGQALDLEAERLHAGERPDAGQIARLQAMKTGRLITVACEMGAILGEAAPGDRAALKHYGEALGYAFQISDDLLDAEGGAETVGKATGKDAAAGKATLVSLLGITQARVRLDSIVAEAIAALEPFGDKATILAEAARFMGRRNS